MSSTSDTYNDIIHRVYMSLVSSTLTIDEIEQTMIAAAVRAGASQAYARKIVASYLDA